MEILERVRATIRERHLLPPEGGVVIVGYSGGADSTALLHLLTRLQDELRICVHAAHLHHGMRTEADADVEVCRQVCTTLGVPLHVERVDVPARARAQKISLEEAGRNARYEFFERLADELGATAVALAHTRDDQIETILINLLRGTGPRGLRGMPYKRDRIIRPLLDVSREQTHRYCADHNLPTVFDITNLDPHQMRRRVRAELIPVLRAIAPAFERHLLRLAAIVEAEEAWWADEIQRVLAQLSSTASHPQVLPRADFAHLHPAVQRRVLREWLRPHVGTLNLPPFEILEAIRHAAMQGERTSWQLSPTLRLTTDPNALTLHHASAEPAPYEYPVVPEAPTYIPEAGVWLEVRLLATDAVPANWQALPTEAFLDADAVQGMLRVRNGRTGERFQPLGMPAPKKLSDIFTDRKVPRAERWRLPLLCDDAGVLWIPTYTIAERAKITPSTQRVLHARLYRNDAER
ncbi:MAG: tRNA lysidine(34) synthetase TilS [Fimbriimonadales bacterium]|nr:tRNA lysidine(34) synthetase TilS [Fimbriimonadales bacterium]MDW8051604.1 tRNA lysidine(34) synthetase TilS [Armatimonadota bacterium]